MNRKDVVLVIKVGVAVLAWMDYSKRQTTAGLVRAATATLAVVAL